jgi:predicted acyltransferase
MLKGSSSESPTGEVLATAPELADAPVSGEAPERLPGPGRIRSLDFVRGLMLTASILINSIPDTKQWFAHAKWTGIHPEDLVFPTFVMLSGCGLAFAYRNRVGWVATVRRCAILVTAGLAYNAIRQHLGGGDVHWSTLRWTGPLQVYAVLVLLVGLLHLVARSWRAWLAITVGAALAHTWLLWRYGQGCPDQLLTPTCNPSQLIDTAWLGDGHMYARGSLGHDPEGLLGIAGAFVSAAAGVTAGHLLLAMRGRPVACLARIAAIAGLWCASALLLGGYVPAMKRLWTAPFALGVAGAVVIALGLGTLLLDRPATGRSLRALSWPQTAMGRNSLLIYFGSHVLMMFLVRPRGEAPSLAESWQARLEGLGHPQVAFSLALLVGWSVLAAVLHWRRIYLRA